jgi:hypothetical protein
MAFGSNDRMMIEIESFIIPIIASENADDDEQQHTRQDAVEQFLFHGSFATEGKMNVIVIHCGGRVKAAFPKSRGCSAAQSPDVRSTG